MTEEADRRRARLVRWTAWLDQRRELPLLPEQSIVDPHHHLWDRGGHTYLQDELRADIADNAVIGTVYVECLANYRNDGPLEVRPVGETEFVTRLTATNQSPPRIATGIVGYADLALGAKVGEVLDAHRDVAGANFKGIRYATACDADTALHKSYPTRPGMLLEAGVVAGADELARHGLSLDVWLYFHQLNEAQRLARACPNLSMVIDHCGGVIGIGGYSARRAEVFDEWRQRLEVFQQLSQVSLKFGGLAMPLSGFGLKERPVPPSSEELAEIWRPYFEVCLEVFGPSRLMFESNFPVDRSGCSYTVLWNAFKRLSAALSTDERDALFARTAQRVYRLTP